MDIHDNSIVDLWKAFHRNSLEYIVVGGFATTFNGFARYTADLDIWIKDTLENRKKLRIALNELEIGNFEALETTQLIPGFSSISLPGGFELDLMTYLKGLDQTKFDECYELSPNAMIDGIPVKFLHINRLIEAKKASGRPQDLIDIEELEKIRKGGK